MRIATTLIALGLVGILSGPRSIADPGRIRARDLGVPFDGTPGELNAITDVTGVEVGYSTIISGKGPLEVGKGPVRTGVTAILPRGKKSVSIPVFAAWYSQNGFGEMTGTTSIQERGFLRGPVMITNTHSVGTVHEAVISWRVKQGDRERHIVLLGRDRPEMEFSQAFNGEQCAVAGCSSYHDISRVELDRVNRCVIVPGCGTGCGFVHIADRDVTNDLG